jgi:hypothetical protein
LEVPQLIALSGIPERGLSACGKQEKGAERDAIFVYKQPLKQGLSFADSFADSFAKRFASF